MRGAQSFTDTGHTQAYEQAHVDTTLPICLRGSYALSKNVPGRTLCFAAFLAAIGLILDDPSNILPGLWKITITEDALITDYMEIAGVGRLCQFRPGHPDQHRHPLSGQGPHQRLYGGRDRIDGRVCAVWEEYRQHLAYHRRDLPLCQAAARALFYTYASVSLLATALSPVVSYVALDNGWGNLPAGVLVGILIGFILPPLSAYTYKIKNGMNLYNMGFACGLLALILAPVMSSMGARPVHQLPLGHRL